MANGHRDRVFTKFLNNELGLSELDLLEVILFYCIARKDVRPIAKRLLKRFGGINEIIKADSNLLLEVPGVGKKTAVFFRILSLLDKRIVVKSTLKITNVHDAVEYFKFYFSSLRKENFLIVLLADNGDIIESIVCSSDKTDRVNIDIKQLSIQVAKVNAKSVVIAHNHTSGLVNPSVSDDVTTKKILTILNAQSVNLLDHLIFSEDDYFSYHSTNRLNDLREELLK